MRYRKYINSVVLLVLSVTLIISVALAEELPYSFSVMWFLIGFLISIFATLIQQRTKLGKWYSTRIQEEKYIFPVLFLLSLSFVIYVGFVVDISLDSGFLTIILGIAFASLFEVAIDDLEILQ